MQPNLTMVLEQVGKDKGIDVKILLQTPRAVLFGGGAY